MLTLIEPPVPVSAPSRLDVHVIWLVRVVLSSSISVAFAWKLTVAPKFELEPFAGDVSVTTGALLVIVTVIESDPEPPPLSVTEAVMVWTPMDSVLTLIEPPLPTSAPSRFDDHVMLLVSGLSWSSTSDEVEHLRRRVAGRQSAARTVAGRRYRHGREAIDRDRDRVGARLATAVRH